MRRALFRLLALSAACVALAGVACGGGGSNKLPTAPSSTLPLVTVSSAIHVTPNPKATPPSDLVLRQKAFITARGFYPDDPITASAVGELGGQLYAFRSTCAISVTVNHDNCQIVHFFLDSTYLGTDTAYTFYGYETVTAGQGHVTVSYTTYAPDDPECCPTVKQNVVYSWNNEYVLLASGEPPRPRDEPFDKNGRLANKTAPLYIAAYPKTCAPTSLTVPSGDSISIAFVNESGTPNALQVAGPDLKTETIAAGAQAVLNPTFTEREAPYGFDCGSGKGEIRVVRALPQS